MSDGNVTDLSQNAKKDVSLQSIYISVVLNGSLLLATLIIFELLLKCSCCSHFLAPRLKRASHAQLRKLFGWLRLTLTADQKDVTPDCKAVISFCDLGFKFSIIGSLFDFFLMPWYASADPCHACSGFNKYSISNLGRADSLEESSERRFWATVVAAYALTICFCSLVASEWTSFIAMRRENFIRTAQGLGSGGTEAALEAAQAIRSVMVECVPESARSHNGVHAFFETLFGKYSVNYCVLHNDASNLYTSDSIRRVYNGDAGTSQRQSRCCCCCYRNKYALKTIRRLSDDHADQTSSFGVELPSPFKKKRPTPLMAAQTRPRYSSTSPRLARKVTWDCPDSPCEKRKLRDVIDHGVEAASNVGQVLLKRATSFTELLQQVTIGQSATSTAFVTFHSVATAVLAEQALLSHQSGWIVQRAPEARNLIWFNVQKPYKQLVSRNRLVNVGLALGFVFWAIPMAAIQGWANVSSLRDVPFLTMLSKDFPIIYSLLTSYLPVLALYGLQQLLPPLFHCIAVKYEGHKIKSKVECTVLNRYILFSMASLYFTTLSGGLWKVVEEFFRAPKSFLIFLSRELPMMAVYFMTYVLAGVGLSVPWYLFRLWELLLYGSDVSAVHCDLASSLGPVSLMLFIGLTFSFIAPAILPFCAVYFGCISIMFRWLFLCVYEQEFDGDGEVWYGLFNSLLIGLFMGVALLMSMALTFATRVQLLVLTPLPILVIVFIGYCWRRKAVSNRRALDDAVMADQETCLFTNRADLYLDPLVKAQLTH